MTQKVSIVAKFVFEETIIKNEKLRKIRNQEFVEQNKLEAE